MIHHKIQKFFFKKNNLVLLNQVYSFCSKLEGIKAHQHLENSIPGLYKILISPLSLLLLLVSPKENRRGRGKEAQKGEGDSNKVLVGDKKERQTMHFEVSGLVVELDQKNPQISVVRGIALPDIIILCKLFFINNTVITKHDICMLAQRCLPRPLVCTQSFLSNWA